MKNSMKKLYKAKLNNADVWMVREENNTLGMMFADGRDAIAYIAGEKIQPFGVAVNSEVLTMGTSVGFLFEITEQ